MLPITRKPTGDASPRPGSAEEVVPAGGGEPRRGAPAVRPVAGALVAPAAVALAPASGTVGRLVFLGALVLVWAVLVRVVVRRPKPRPWTGIVVGAGLAMLGEGARVLFVSSGRIGFLHGADALRIAADVVLVLSFGAMARRPAAGNGRASILDGAIVACALLAANWPMLDYPSAMSRATAESGGWLGSTRPLFAIVLCAFGVRLIFRRDVASRLL